MEKIYALERFLQPQTDHFEQACAELRNGRKESHWMWFIFPQLKGLGRSGTAQYYGLEGRAEAQAFLQHPQLGPRLVQISTLLLKIGATNANAVFGSPDDLKLHSCMTLFAALKEGDIVFELVLKKFFNGERDSKTLQLLSAQ
jgi:uncharacterized protein (DUF1810 family)